MLSKSKHYIITKGNRQFIVCCLFLFLISPLLSQAQTRGTVEVIKDHRIDTLIARRLESSRSGGSSGSTGGNYISTDGYRVQFFSGSNRTDAYSAQARFKKKYPELRTYITYREPNFKVKAGDFRTRLEATKLMQEIRPIFTSLFIISEKINPPKLDKTDD